MNLEDYEKLFFAKIFSMMSHADPAHDLLHFQRVVRSAKRLCAEEKGCLKIVVPAAWLHDLVIVPKSDPQRSYASRLSAKAALQFLTEIDYPKKYHDEIGHAIEAHSFSANIEARTLEAKIVQDADRLDGIGAIGIARCFATGGLLQRPFYSEDDPFCCSRLPDDKSFTLDHFYAKLLKVVDSLKTKAAQIEGQRRLKIMNQFLADFEIEIEAEPPLTLL